MKEFLDGLDTIMVHGKRKTSRTGIDTISYHGLQMRLNLLGDEFPLVTTRRIPWRACVGEFLWMMNGHTDLPSLQALGVNFWNPWFPENGDGGRIYGHQFRNWGGEVDQVAKVIDSIEADPFGRRHIIDLWNPMDLEHPTEKPILPPCHFVTQFLVKPPLAEGGRLELDTHMNMRSWDVAVGGPFNIGFYALMTKLIAYKLNMAPGELIITAGDAHIYANQIEQVKEQLSREPVRGPKLTISGNPCLKTMNFGIDSFSVNGRCLGEVDKNQNIEINLDNYAPLDHIPFPVAI